MITKSHSLRAWFLFACSKFLLGVLVFALATGPVFAAEGINEQIHFQGKIVNTDGTNVTDGTYSFEFKIYTVDTAGTAIWTETRSGGNVVAVDDGVFSVDLGSVTALPGSVDFNSDTLYLGVNFNGDGEMAPRIRLTAVPYAHNAAKVSGLTVTNTTGTLTIPNGTIIAFSGANNLTFTTTGATGVTLPTTGTLATLAGTEEFTNKTIGSTGLTFSGATNDIVTATDQHFSIMPNGVGNVGIGTTDPTYMLDIRRDQNALTGFRVYNNTNNSAATAAFGLRSSSSAGALILFSDSYTAGGLLPHFAGRMNLLGDLANPPDGIDFVSPDATGDFRFYAGGYTTAHERLRIGSTGDLTWMAATPSITINSAETFTVGPSGGDTFTVNTSGSLFSFLDGSGNGFTFDADTGPVFAGTARVARKSMIVPEYQGAVLTGDGGNNTGTMTSDFCEQGVHANIPDTNTSVCNTSGDIHNYYSWTTNQGTAQDYDIWVRWRVPENFAAWDTNPVQVYGKRTDATNNAITVFVHDSAGALNNSGGTQVAGTNWTQTAIALSGGTWTAGSYVTFRITLTADTGGDQVQVGEINLNYLSNN